MTLMEVYVCFLYIYFHTLFVCSYMSSAPSEYRVLGINPENVNMYASVTKTKALLAMFVSS